MHHEESDRSGAPPHIGDGFITAAQGRRNIAKIVRRAGAIRTQCDRAFRMSDASGGDPCLKQAAR